MRITIIGGGASGTLLAINLLEQKTDERLEIDLIERRGAGGGVAFSTPHDFHLLNVPAAKMSAVPEYPNHFMDWLRSEGHNYEPMEFVPRRLFGKYLTQLLDSRIASSDKNVRLNILRDEALDIALNGNSAEVSLRSGEVLRTDRVVLAFGNFLPPHPSVHDLKFISADKYIHDVWAPSSFDIIQPDDEVLIIGTGLSMVDVVLRLDSDAHRGKISALSTKGLLPAVHKLGSQYESFYDELRGLTRITDLLKKVRMHISSAESDGSDWRAVIDSLRPHTQEIWRGLPTEEKRYFLQHLSRHWNAARHRMPQAAAAKIEKMTAAGRLELRSGRLRHISVDESGRFLVNFAVGGEQHYLTVDVLVNCIGSEANFAKVDSTLVRNLLAAGSIRCDPVNLGLDATADGRLIDRSGIPSDVLRTLGTALKGTLWETTAIPEIRVQARELAFDLCRPSSEARPLAERMIE